MKRTVLLTATMAVALLASASLIMAQGPTPSVPNLIDFQGKLTTPAGNPVADGPHSFVYRIYDASGGGTLLWTEGPLGISTTGGLFTHQLGSSTTLPQTLFTDYDQLWLEVEADGAIITPRTRLVSNPYTRVANDLEVASTSFPGTTALGTDPFEGRLIVHGEDGERSADLGANGWGFFRLYDESVPSDNTVTLEAGFGTGGSLSLRQEDGTAGVVLRGGSTADGATLTMRNAGGAQTISLDADLTGNSAAVVPADAISSPEILDDAGIAGEYGPSFFFLANTTANQKVDSVTITTPAAGKVLVLASGYLNINHTTGTIDNVGVNVQTDPLASVFTNGVSSFMIEDAEPTGISYRLPFSCVRLFNAASATSLKIYLIVHQATGANIGSNNLAYSSIQAVYLPETYGPTPVLVAARPGVPSGSVDGTAGTGAETSDMVTYQTAEEFKALKQQEINAQMAELEARIKRLEETTKQQGTVQETDDNR